MKMRIVRNVSFVLAVLLVTLLMGCPSAIEITPITGVAISGTAEVGEELTAGDLTPAGATADYQWTICGTEDGTYTDISGATGSTYTLVAADEGKYLKVVATGTGNYSGTVTSEATAAVAEKVYAIGDTGPAGGLVFYDKGSMSNGWRYLEATSAATEWSNKVWGGQGTLVDGTGTAVGTGAANTVAIVAALGAGDYAAKLCSDLEVTTDGVEYDDWFLPSKDELDLMYQMHDLNSLGGFADYYYWSSSEFNSVSALLQYFINGTSHYEFKSSSVRVRAVRAF